MVIRIIDQATTHTRRTYWAIKLTTLFPAKLVISENRPHDGTTSIPQGFESRYRVRAEKLSPSDLSAVKDWKDSDHWLPWVLRRTGDVKATRTIVYYHGGGFLHKMNSFHWHLAGRLANDLDADIVMQTYLMVPHAGIHENIDKLCTMFELVHATAKSHGHEVIVGGDSVGGTITASLLLALKDRSLPLPDQTFLIAPALDLNGDSPEAREIQPLDAMIRIDDAINPFRAWATGPIDPEAILQSPTPMTNELLEKLQHPYASPIFGDWSFLAEIVMPITIVQGTHDVLLPQVEQFVAICERSGVELTYIRAGGAAHVYPLLWCVPMANLVAPDSEVGLRLLVDSIQTYGRAD